MDFFYDLFNETIAPDYTAEQTILFNKDCIKILETMKDNSIDLVVTDPPYRISPGGGGVTKNGKKYCSGLLSHTVGDNIKNAKSGKLFDYNDIKFKEWLPEIYRILKENTHCYIFINARNLLDLWESAEQIGFTFQNLIVWNKRQLYAKPILYELL